MLRVSKPAAPNFYTLFCLIPLTLFVSRNLTLSHLPLFRSLDSLLCNLIAPTPGLVFLTDATYTSGAVIIFVRQGLSFFELSTSSLSLLDPYSDYVGVNIFSNNSSLLSFLNVYAPPICSSPTDGRTDSFSPPSFRSSEISSFEGTSTNITLSGTQKIILTPMERKY